ncbi:PBP1A family penicillin-binding protein [Treponema phagedenis]|uniref:peptidoglycan glycosyltransferase n=1 Tax=Treponema phagedenis TaxID=162 RepID=A0A0B7GV96_TREPH|nr:PBP1A family penicillin-binding protein [Treponema phagedenis]QSH99843.1 PBP1A family penicillin-binding protein [Treponema phagedenis]CEM62589.1 Penicillin-binding protein, 1A family [Treponema phagedenis]
MRGKVIFIYLFFLFAILISGSALLGYLLASTVNIKQSERFTDFNPVLPTRILDIRGDLITEFSSDEKREIIKFEQISPYLIAALLTREDRTFYSHKGYNLKAIFRAAIGILTDRSLGGGSTLTQQIAGLLYCDRTDQSIKRKVKELWWALQMERRYSKDEIMELYLNKVYFGGGTYGVNAASRFYFGHPVQEITPAEAAILVILLSNPAYYNPFEYPNRARERQAYILSEMTKLGYISREEQEESYNEYWANFDYTRTTSSAYFNREDKAPWFSEYVRRQLDNMMYGTMNLYEDGYTVYTTCDLRHQAVAEKQVTDYIDIANQRVRSSSSTSFAQGQTYSNITALLSLTFNLPQLRVGAKQVQIKSTAYYRNKLNPLVDMMALICGMDSLKIASNKGSLKMQENLAKRTVEGTLISLENETGYITALVGGSKYSASNQMIRAIQGYLQPGSAYKPLLYSAAIDTKRITPATQLEDVPQVFGTTDIPYIPNNYGGRWRGTVLTWRALAQSLNIPAIKILDTIGFDAVINRSAALLGITDRAEIERVFPKVYPLALGVIAIRPVQLARAFAIFGNQGQEVTPIAIRTIEDRSGNIVLDPEKELRIQQRKKGNATQIISPQNAYIMTSMLKKTLTIGTLTASTQSTRKFMYKDANTGRYFTMPVAGKTGTTQNWTDAWSVGYSPYYTALVWFGFDRGGLSLGLNNTGAALAGPPWANFMQAIHEGKPYKDFIRPETGIVSVSVCSKSGKLPSEYCTDAIDTLYFLSGTQPTSYCTYHESSKRLEDLAKERLRKSSYTTGTIPTDINEGGVFLDPRIFEDPTPSTKRKPKNYFNEFDEEIEDEDSLPIFEDMEEPEIENTPSEIESNINNIPPIGVEQTLMNDKEKEPPAADTQDDKKKKSTETSGDNQNPWL